MVERMRGRRGTAADVWPLYTRPRRHRATRMSGRFIPQPDILTGQSEPHGRKARLRIPVIPPHPIPPLLPKHTPPFPLNLLRLEPLKIRGFTQSDQGPNRPSKGEAWCGSLIR